MPRNRSSPVNHPNEWAAGLVAWRSLVFHVLHSHIRVRATMGDTAEGDSGDRHQRLARRAVVDELLHAITAGDRPYTVVLGAPGTGVRTLIGKQLPRLLDGHAAE